MLPVFPRNVGSLEIRISQKYKNPNIWWKKNKKNVKATAGANQTRVQHFRVYPSKTAWTLGPVTVFSLTHKPINRHSPEGNGGYIYMLEPSLHLLWRPPFFYCCEAL